MNHLSRLMREEPASHVDGKGLRGTRVLCNHSGCLAAHTFGMMLAQP